jgi:hypothetical protein
MVAKTEQVVSNKLDTFKLLLAIAILIAGIVGFYYYEAESQLYRVLGVVFMHRCGYCDQFYYESWSEPDRFWP